jgi:hypothetical protein
MKRAPDVSEEQAKLLRLARDAGLVVYADARPATLHACRRKRWLADRREGFVLTDGGRAALAYFDASKRMLELWAR